MGKSSARPGHLPWPQKRWDLNSVLQVTTEIIYPRSAVRARSAIGVAGFCADSGYTFFETEHKPSKPNYVVAK